MMALEELSSQGARSFDAQESESNTKPSTQYEASSNVQDGSTAEPSADLVKGPLPATARRKKWLALLTIPVFGAIIPATYFFLHKPDKPLMEYTTLKTDEPPLLYAVVIWPNRSPDIRVYSFSEESERLIMNNFTVFSRNYGKNFTQYAKGLEEAISIVPKEAHGDTQVGAFCPDLWMECGQFYHELASRAPLLSTEEFVSSFNFFKNQRHLALYGSLILANRSFFAGSAFTVLTVAKEFSEISVWASTFFEGAECHSSPQGHFFVRIFDTRNFDFGDPDIDISPKESCFVGSPMDHDITLDSCAYELKNPKLRKEMFGNATFEGNVFVRGWINLFSDPSQTAPEEFSQGLIEKLGEEACFSRSKRMPSNACHDLSIMLNLLTENRVKFVVFPYNQSEEEVMKMGAASQLIYRLTVKDAC